METKKWWHSVTHLVLVVMVITLCGMVVYSLVFTVWERFDYIMTLFSNIMIAVTSFYFGKSTLETANKKANETEAAMTKAALTIPGAETPPRFETKPITPPTAQPKEDSIFLTV